MLLGDGRDVVDGQIKQQYIAVRSKAHVVDGFGAQTHTQTALGVAQVQQQRFSVSVDVTVVGIGVVDFPRVLNPRRPSPTKGVEAVGPCSHVFRQCQQQGILGNGPAGLEFAHKTCAEGHFCFPIGPALLGKEVIQIHGSVYSTYGAGAVDEPAVKIKALAAVQGLDLDSVNRTQNQSNSVQRIVNAQGTFLVGAQDNSASKLLVKVAHCEVDLSFFIGIAGEAIAHPAALESSRETEHSAEVGFVAQAG